MPNDTKVCKSCREAKPLGDFSRHPQTRDGRNTACRKCDAARLRARTEAIKAQPKITPATKTCPSCETDKPASEFGKRAALKDGLAYECKPCTRKRDADYRAANPEQAEKNRQRLRELYADQPRYLDYMYRNKFGITWARYQEILTSQGGKCAICDREPSKQRLSVDHDHNCCPGKSKSCGECVRGLLCSDCNFGLGLFRDNAGLLHKAVSYLAT